MDKELTRFATCYAANKAKQLIARGNFESNEFEDVRQSLLLYYLENMYRYDPSTGVPEKGYASVLIDSAANRLVTFAWAEQRGRQCPKVSLDAPVRGWDEDSLLADIIPGSKHMWQDPLRRFSAATVDEKLFREKFFADMPPKIKALLKEFTGASAADVARAKGTTRQVAHIQKGYVLKYFAQRRKKLNIA